MKKDSPQVSAFKKTLIILGILFSLELLGLTLITILDLTYLGISSKPRTFSIKASDLENDDITIESNVVEELDILPTSYESLVTNFGAFSPHELTTFLRYGKVIKSSDQTSLTDAYQYLIDSDTNILIPQTYIDEFLLDKIYNIANLLQEENSNNTEILPYITISQSSVILQKLNQCIQENIDQYLTGTSCTEELQKITNEELAPTLSFLIQSLKYGLNSEENDYNRYISNNLQLYTINSSFSDNSENISSTYTNNLALDLNIEHVHKLTLIANYLELISQSITTSKNAGEEIEELSQITDFLSTYGYGSEIPEEIKQLIQNPALNLNSSEISYAQLNPNVSYLIKSMSINDNIETFITPIYTFTGTQEQSVPSLVFEINDANFDEPYDVTPTTQARGTVRIPIFMYHRIEPVPEGQSRFKSGLYVDPLDFEKQMAYLVKKNYKTVNSLEYYNLLKAGKNPTQKTTMITFDDGSLGQYTTAYPILKKYGLTGVFYIISQKSGINGTQAREMANNGMDIGSHSARHPDLTKVTDDATLSSEIISSKYALQSATGKTVYAFCYPGCGWNSQTLSYVSSAGYLLGMSCGASVDNYPGHNLVLSRVHAFGDMQSFKNLLSGVH